MYLDRLRPLAYSGLFGSIYVWIIIALCYRLNPDFVFTQGAFSQFGSPGANYPYVYNVFGMIGTGIALLLFSASIVAFSKNRVEVVGGAFLAVASVFLMMIGVFHGGTYPHDFVSEYFFVQADLSILAFGAGLVGERSEKLGAISLTVGVFAPILALAVKFPSSATLEAFGIICIEIWVISVTFLWDGFGNHKSVRKRVLWTGPYTIRTKLFYSTIRARWHSAPFGVKKKSTYRNWRETN
ncbi:MAG: DUF998 domain-containing protein [Thermoprotei archaeon]